MSSEAQNTEKEELSPLEQQLTKISAYDFALAEMKEKVEKSLTIANVNDKKGYDEVYKNRQLIRNTRLAIQNMVKDSVKGHKDEYEEKKKKIEDAGESWISKLEPLEKTLSDREKIYNDEKERIKQEKIEAEKKRIQARGLELTTYGLNFDGVSYFNNDFNIRISFDDVKSFEDDEFEVFMSQVHTAFEEQAKKEKEAEDKRLAELLDLQEREKKIQQDKDDLQKREQALQEKTQQIANIGSPSASLQNDTTDLGQAKTFEQPDQIATNALSGNPLPDRSSPAVGAVRDEPGQPAYIYLDGVSVRGIRTSTPDLLLSFPGDVLVRVDDLHYLTLEDKGQWQPVFKS